ncbi:polyketide cyclase [bacterium SCN 62-11]|nr:SRPBCC family protein [Candidatus Eremiobacteraeota bacterium]ODT58595.1 MAG: polyketide cyclase [bacterium SCN 62-11]
MNQQYQAGAAGEARVEKQGERWTLILVRQFRHKPEKVWQAITDPVHLREWAPFDADASLAHQGATVTLTTIGAQATQTTIVKADRPHLLEYSWGENHMRWQLEEHDNGTRMTLWHNIPQSFVSMGAAGWHICFDVLEHLVDGNPLGRIVGPDAMQHGWPRLKAEYEARFEA